MWEGAEGLSVSSGKGITGGSGIGLNILHGFRAGFTPDLGTVRNIEN